MMMCVEGTKKLEKMVAQKILGLIWEAMTGVATLTIFLGVGCLCKQVGM